MVKLNRWHGCLYYHFPIFMDEHRWSWSNVWTCLTMLWKNDIYIYIYIDISPISWKTMFVYDKIILFFYHCLNHCWYLKIQWFGSYHFPMSKTYFGDLFCPFSDKKKRQRSILENLSLRLDLGLCQTTSKKCSWNIDLKQGWHQSLIDSGGRACGFQDHPDPFHVQSCYGYILIGGLEHEFYDFPYIGNNNGYICKLWTLWSVYISVSIILWSIELGSMLPSCLICQPPRDPGGSCPVVVRKTKNRRGSFAKKHRTTVFKPFKIQELMIDAVLQPGAELRAVRSFPDDFTERISGTGKSNSVLC